MTDYAEAQWRVLAAAFEVGQAQAALEDAEKMFRDALDQLASLEGIPGLPAVDRGDA
jgi:hypothetical protein